MPKRTTDRSVSPELVVITLSTLEDALDRVLERRAAAAQHPASATPAVMTTSATAEYLGSTAEWVRKQVRAGNLDEAPASNQRRMLITRASADRLLASVA